MAYTPAGTPISVQTTGNCHSIVCDGEGGLSVEVDDANVPDDNNPCTEDLCSNGTPSNPPEAQGQSCGGALTCDGNGNCKGCTAASDCPGTDDDCDQRSCTAGVCGHVYTAANTSTSSQTTGDCKQNVCNGLGAVSVIFDQSDPPTEHQSVHARGLLCGHAKLHECRRRNQMLQQQGDAVRWSRKLRRLPRGVRLRPDNCLLYSYVHQRSLRRKRHGQRHRPGVTDAGGLFEERMRR